MTSETETLKTNEFLRRRKLRLQQVREQSKDIAKKIRQRAKVEGLLQVVDLDVKKQKEYFDRQEKLVERLEVLYSKGLNKLGAGHQSASALNQQVTDEINKTDLSKLRGKEAAADLRKKRQEKLDQQKKLLDRRLQAREAANELSREKSSVVTNKLSQKPSQSADDKVLKSTPSAVEVVKDSNQVDAKNKDEPETVSKNDMATQWDVEIIPNEWDPTVPTLKLPTDDQDKGDDNIDSKSEKKLDLFALSEEMPSDLRGRHTDLSEGRSSIRPSLTLVTEHLQSRHLQLRESEITHTKKSEDMSNIKKTIQRIRAKEGTLLNACHVLDEQVIPVPSWHAENKCHFCAHCMTTNNDQPVTNSQMNRIFRSNRQNNLDKMSGIMPRPTLRSTSPYRRNKTCQQPVSKATTNTKPDKNKNSVLMYNHNTRDIRDLPCSDEHLVVRDIQTSEDAYSLAMRESESTHIVDQDHKKAQDMRTRVAVTKQAVEKEYKDTINFLNSIPKDGKVTKVAYMNDRRQQMVNESRQHKMQQEYRKIEKECRRHHTCLNRNKSKSPLKNKDDFDRRDFQYSWMPVPEGDGNLAVHTIPNTVKEGKSGNTVKFSKVDSYHEYRSRHKHTPPTKDTSEKKSNKKCTKTVVIDKNSSQSSEESSTVSNTSSVENLALNKDDQEKSKDQSSSDAERIIIYKILDTKNKHCKRKNKVLSDIAKSLSSVEQVQKPIDNTSESDNLLHKRTPITKTVSNTVSFEQINEGVYKVSEQGDNIISMQINANQESCEMDTATGQVDQTCHCRRRAVNVDKGHGPQWQDADNIPCKRISESCQCASTSKVKDATPTPTKKVQAMSTKQLSPRTSTSSFKTAVNDKSATTEAGYIKLVDEAGHEAGKFYLDPTGFLKDNAYEVVIQLRRKSDGNEKNLLSKPKISEETKSSEEIIFVNQESDISRPIPANEVKEILQARSEDDMKSKIITPPISTEQVSDNNLPVTDNKEEKAVSNSDLISNNDIRIMPPGEEKKDVTENATNVIENEPTMPKYDPPSRPATTTYTQTTNSPIHRPIYFHMSSSTSTAYMSPPEMILPGFLKHDYVMTEDEVCELENIETAHDKCRKKCKHARKSRSDINLKRRDYNKNSTPPNTARSMLINDLHDTCKVPRIDPLYKKYITDKTKCKCYNCDIHNPIKDRAKKQCTKSKTAPIVSKQMSRNLNMLTKDNVTTKNKSKRAGSCTKKDSLNLIIRDYINRLLTLNRQGLKAIEVAEQECSSVGTPGSSIIDVPFNIDERKPSIDNKISLEQVKKVLLQQIVNENLKSNLHRESKSESPRNLCPIPNKPSNYLSRKPRKKPVHKVKSLNISKRVLKPNKKEESKRTKLVSLSTTTDDNSKTFGAYKARPRTSPITRQTNVTRSTSAKPPSAKKCTKIGVNKNDTVLKFSNKENTSKIVNSPHRKDNLPTKDRIHIKLHKSTFTDTVQDSELSKDSHDYYKNKADIPISMSTQTSQNIDCDFVTLAEDKLLNMEKIADLTEKCTKRLSNLAKALEEVRKNKSSAYSAISTSESTDSYSDLKADEMKTSVQTDSNDINKLEFKSLTPVPAKENITSTAKENAYSVFIPLLSDIPKIVCPLPQPSINDSVAAKTVTNAIQSLPASPVSTDKNMSEITKSKPKPPPALSRIHLKHSQEQVVPHELSTVLEVDSPLSVKNKNQSSRTELPSNDNKSPSKTKNTAIYFNKNGTSKTIKPTDASHLVHSKLEMPKLKLSSTDSSDDSKFQMIDLKQFNEIMLEPFLSIHEYAKKYNVEVPDEGSNMEDVLRDELINDDISSLHSDGSLPDVIAELLKRNVITEPFKFDTGSNVNSNTISSESTLSMLTLSKSRKVKRRSNIMFQNKENIGETSDTMSISSNPDLENAFKKLGMGWASSTLKKTKERLALSSSSNTSSSSLQQFRLKNFNQDIPALVTDSVSSVLLSKKGPSNKNNDESSKNVEQQTSFANSMIVKEFLKNELANKITFTSNRSGMNDTEDEFVSLYETKMPEGMKQQTLVNRDEQSNDSVPSGVNRARTSTPVQLFKSMTYHSTSSSNLSNGLFSNADDLSSVKITSNSMKNHSTSDKDDLTIPNFSLKLKKTSDCSKSD